ncbi:MAG: AAA family ATPase [Sphingomonas sp.]|uniref:AAA family ATPase n=1 Tax=Sphingomonas sp. TaxID=28214 RepID=UPI0025E56701|nr:AAA family ATPase [Sphingomonas sp.]MBX3564379.1 AAA family ATPase [Sphingomonas sp.]
MSGFELRSLRVTGPGKTDAEMTFEAGLNVVSGPSDTGKSYLVEAIDFMLGGQTPPRQIPESVGYDRAHLVIESKSGTRYELTRALDGGDFQLRDLSSDDDAAVTLAGRHSSTDPDNISTFLLRLVGLDQKRLRKNVNNELQNLSFRNLAALLIVDEETIIKKSSPILSGESTQKTAQVSLFKLLLTGVDDSALVATKKPAIAKAEIEGQIAVLDELIADYESDLKELTESSADELVEQLDRLDASIAASERAMSAERAQFEEQEQARRDAWRTAERIQGRQAEISGLKERFALLDQSYTSDLQRLESIAEAGAYFVALPQGTCPLCGAPAGDHRHDGVAQDGDVDRLREACDSEIAKIRQLQSELATAVSDLDGERDALGAGASNARLRFDTADALVRETLAPALSAARRQVDELYSVRADVKRALTLVDRIAAMTARRAEAHAALGSAGRSNDERPGLPAASVQAISVAVEELLDAWRFPHEKPVYFDETRQDMVLGSRRRGDQGKGLRAITHAAFTIGLQQAIRTLGRDSAGFIVLDSPLVTFREADHDDELAPDQKVAVKQAFYADLAGRADLSQIIVFENEDPDPALRSQLTIQLFSKQDSSGRYGFFPRPQPEPNLL